MFHPIQCQKGKGKVATMTLSKALILAIVEELKRTMTLFALLYLTV